MKPLTPQRIKAARAVAFLADVLQIALFPVMFEGVFSIFDDIFDVAVCVVLTVLVGWHSSFVPSVLLKAVPFVDMVPTWSIAVFLATRQKSAPTVNVVPPPVYDPPGVPPRINLPAGPPVIEV